MILNKEGILANPSEKGLYLGNGRSVSTIGLWMMHNTNNYNFSEKPEFRDLMQEETNLISKIFAVIYALIQYFIDNNPSIHDIKIPVNENEIINIAESALVKKFINKEVTERMNSYFFSAVGKIETAEKILRGSYLTDSYSKKEKKLN